MKSIDKALEQAHKDYETEKKTVISNLKGIKVFYKQLYQDGVICKDCYKGLTNIINHTIKFINKKEI